MSRSPNSDQEAGIFEDLYLEIKGTMGVHWLSDLSNFASLVYHTMPDLNWCGFYLRKHNHLVLGPFQGKLACQLIPIGKGVCGQAAVQRKTIRVGNVHNYPGHIACDSRSNSELVVPLIYHDKKSGSEHLLGVLDLDSPSLNRFTADDQKEVEKLVQILVPHLNQVEKEFCALSIDDEEESLAAKFAAADKNFLT